METKRRRQRRIRKGGLESFEKKREIGELRGTKMSGWKEGGEDKG